jgi:hypothetical protein
MNEEFVPLHPLALEAWDRLEESDGVISISEGAVAHFKEAIRNVKRMEVRSAVMSFVTIAEKLYNLRQKAACDAMIAIAYACNDALAFANDDVREQARKLQDKVSGHFAAFHGLSEKKIAPRIDAPRPQGAISAKSLIRPFPRRTPNNR